MYFWIIIFRIPPSPFSQREFFSKTYPSFLTLKEGSTSHLGLLPSGKKRETALLGARNRFALRLAGHQSPSPYCAGWDRLGKRELIVYSLQLAGWSSGPKRSSPDFAGWDRRDAIIGALCSWGNQRDYFMLIIKRNSLENVELENKNSNKLYQNILNGYSEQIKRYWMQM